MHSAASSVIFSLSVDHWPDLYLPFLSVYITFFFLYRKFPFLSSCACCYLFLDHLWCLHFSVSSTPSLLIDIQPFSLPLSPLSSLIWFCASVELFILESCKSSLISLFLHHPPLSRLLLFVWPFHFITRHCRATLHFRWRSIHCMQTTWA